jgi:predicted small secreted protein
MAEMKKRITVVVLVVLAAATLLQSCATRDCNGKRMKRLDNGITF